jgi:hypothetical protein
MIRCFAGENNQCRCFDSLHASSTRERERVGFGMPSGWLPVYVYIYIYVCVCMYMHAWKCLSLAPEQWDGFSFKEFIHHRFNARYILTYMLPPKIEALRMGLKKLNITFLGNGCTDFDYILIIYGDHLTKYNCV